jgi:hypothetical protein
MKRFRLGWVVIAPALAGLLVSTLVLAGFKAAQDVVISDSSQFANGMLGYVRNTSDTTQYVGCEAFGTSGYCFALNSAGTYRTCVTSDSNLVANIRSLNSDSYLLFYWNSNGQCTDVVVQNSSYTPPKGP